MKVMTIGKLARRAGVSVETVRYYERRGLLEAPSRRSSGYRQYGEDVVSRLAFIRRAKELGFTLIEIKELLSLRLDPTSDCGDVKSRAEAKIADIEARIRSLKSMSQTLRKLSAECSGEGSVTDCPILDAMETLEDEP